MDAPIIVNGACGRMGRLVVSALREAGLGPIVGCEREGARTEPPDSIPMTSDLRTAVAAGGVVVDFSHPSATEDLLAAVEARAARLVIGTTGQSETQIDRLRRAAERVPIVLSSNFSLGIQRILQLIPALRVFMDDGFDLECLEVHHRAKRDAPSGTAKALLEALLGPGAEAHRVHGRLGPEAGRHEGEVGVHSVRLGGVVGDHALLFGNDHEVVEIRHRALDRAAFVSGVAPAVRFVRHRAPGLYSMLDVMRDATASAT